MGIELDQIGDEDLADHIAQAWRLIAPKKFNPVRPSRGGYTLRPLRVELLCPTNPGLSVRADFRSSAKPKDAPKSVVIHG